MFQLWGKLSSSLQIQSYFFPAFSPHQSLTTLSTWSTAAGKVHLLKRYSCVRDWEIKWKRAFWMKGVKSSLLVCQVCGVVPASLHIHLSFLHMRCLSQPLATSFCQASNSNYGLFSLSLGHWTHAAFLASLASLCTSCFLSSLLSRKTHIAEVPYVFCALDCAPTFSLSLR